MSSPHPSVTPSDLGEHPELAVLEILDSVLGMVKFAVIAVHPELTDADPTATPSTIEELAADHVLSAVDTLQRVAARYRGIIQVPSRGAHDDPF